jgi:hypothetical protein
LVAAVAQVVDRGVAQMVAVVVDQVVRAVMVDHLTMVGGLHTVAAVVVVFYQVLVEDQNQVVVVQAEELVVVLM